MVDPAGPRPEISVVVASHDRPVRLRWLLNALEEQTLDPRAGGRSSVGHDSARARDRGAAGHAPAGALRPAAPRRPPPRLGAARAPTATRRWRLVARRRDRSSPTTTAAPRRRGSSARSPPRARHTGADRAGRDPARSRRDQPGARAAPRDPGHHPPGCLGADLQHRLPARADRASRRLRRGGAGRRGHRPRHARALGRRRLRRRARRGHLPRGPRGAPRPAACAAPGAGATCPAWSSATRRSAASSRWGSSGSPPTRGWRPPCAGLALARRRRRRRPPRPALGRACPARLRSEPARAPARPQRAAARRDAWTSPSSPPWPAEACAPDALSLCGRCGSRS